MKPAETYVVQFIRIFIGTFYLTSGLNYFLLFYPQPTGRGFTFELVDLMTQINLFQGMKGLDIIAGTLIILNRFTPVALILLFPITVQIFYLTFFSTSLLSIWNGTRNFVFHAILFFAYFRHYAPLFDPRPATTPVNTLGSVWRKRLKGGV